MLKVLHIVWSAHFGGIEKLVLEVCQEQLKQEGIEPAVYFPRCEGEMLPLFEASNIKIERGDFKKGLEFSRAKYQKVRQAFSQYDVLHFHVFNPILARAAKGLDKVLVYTEHGNFGFGRKSTQVDKWLMRLRARFIRKQVHRLLFNSHFSQEYANGNMKLGTTEQEVLYNGVRINAPEDLTPDETLKKQCEGYFVIGTAARFAAFKRIDLLLKSFALMPEKERCKLLLVGDGPMRTGLEELSKELGIAEQVVFTGYLKNVQEATSLMDVFAIPSQNEPFGLTVIEMMGQGTPVLAMEDGGGARELLSMSEPANICQGVEGMAKRLSFLANNTDQISQGKLLRTTFAQDFTIEKHTARLAELYRELRYVRN